jgi:glycosyltransferase involved in cell wall biosynthesis
MKKVIFVSQNLARTGSEMVLWFLLKNLDPKKYAVYVFCITEGELYHTLPSHVKKSSFYKYSEKRKHRILIRIFKIFGVNPLVYQIKKLQQNFKADMWYFNTIVLPDVFDVARTFDVKIITHFHELLQAYTFIRHEELKKIITYSGTCIACSKEVQEKIQNMGHQDVRIQNSFIDPGLIHVKPERVAEIREELGILSSDFVWVISGVATYMKGLDKILPILEAFKHLPVKIIWIGRLLHDGLDFYIKSVTEKKYPGKLIFTGALSVDYYNYMAVANGFLLISREESFSLAMVEAAYLGIPIVAEKVGIAPVFIKEGMGKVVKGINIEQIIDGMEWLHTHPSQNKHLLKQSALEYSVQNQLGHYERLLGQITD